MAVYVSGAVPSADEGEHGLRDPLENVAHRRLEAALGHHAHVRHDARAGARLERVRHVQLAIGGRYPQHVPVVTVWPRGVKMRTWALRQ